MAQAKAKSAKKKPAAKSKAKKSTAKKSASASQADKSVQAYREALDRSLTLSRERIQEVFDDAVKRGRMTRDDANEMMSSLVTRGRKASDDLVKDLEKLLDQARKEVETRVAPVRKRVGTTAAKAGRSVRDAADPAIARADSVRRRAGLPGDPISGYDTLTASQVKSRLSDLTKADLRKVRTREKAGKARKSILSDIEKKLK